MNQKEKGSKRVSIIVGGSGGQGILTLGKVLAMAAIKQKYEVSCLPSYGAEMRGGYVYCTIVISSNRGIFSPVSSEMDIGLFMNEQSCKMLVSYMKEDAYLVINSSLVKNCRNGNFKTSEIPATEIAEELGDIKNANMILAGVLGKIVNKNFLKFNISSLYSGAADVMAGKDLIEKSKINIKAGWELIKNGRCRKND